MAGTLEMSCDAATEVQYVSAARIGNVRSPSTTMKAKKNSGTIERSTRRRRKTAALMAAAIAAGQPLTTRAISSSTSANVIAPASAARLSSGGSATLCSESVSRGRRMTAMARATAATITNGTMVITKCAALHPER